MSLTATSASWSTAEMTARSSSSSARSLSASVIAREPFDLGAARRQLLLEMLIAAIEVIDPVDDRLALGGEPGEHERHRGAEVGGHDRRAGEMPDAAHHRRGAMHIDVGAHAAKLRHMHEAV